MNEQGERSPETSCSSLDSSKGNFFAKNLTSSGPTVDEDGISMHGTSQLSLGKDLYSIKLNVVEHN